MVGCGIYAGFRGSTEHAKLSPQHITTGHYPINYGNSQLAGKQWICISTMPNDKSSKLTVNNSYVRDTRETFRFPIIHNDPKNFGGALLRLMEKLSPGQERMYCMPATEEWMATQKRLGNNGCFYAKKPLGANACTRYLKEAGKLMGLPDTFRPHSLRGVCITKLSNDPTVSEAELLAVTRHFSISSAKPYQVRDHRSEVNRLNALGIDLGEPIKEEEEEENHPCKKAKKGEEEEAELHDPALEALKTKCSKKEVVKEAVTAAAAAPSLTQLGIEELKEELGDLKKEFERECEDDKSDKKPPAKSENQLQIEAMKEQIAALKE